MEHSEEYVIGFVPFRQRMLTVRYPQRERRAMRLQWMVSHGPTPTLRTLARDFLAVDDHGSASAEDAAQDFRDERYLQVQTMGIVSAPVADATPQRDRNQAASRRPPAARAAGHPAAHTATAADGGRSPAIGIAANASSMVTTSDRKAEVAECVACLDNQPCMAAFPCRHLVYCLDCHARAQTQKCPVCRQPVADYVNIIIP